MRRLLYIPTLILLYLLFTAKSCDNQERADDVSEQKQITLSQDSIRSNFESDTLSNASLRAFEGMGGMKLADLGDYLMILGDTAVAETFREKAREMIRGLFLSENSVVRLTGQENPGIREVSVNTLLNPVKGNPVISGKIIPDSVRVKQPLKWIGKAIYAGTLSFAYIPEDKMNKNGPGPASVSGTVDFLVTRHEKNFGKDTLMIWDVFLGNKE